MKQPQKTQVVRSVRSLRKAVSAFRQNGESVALVPTMGALHEGHMSLVELAKKRANRVVVTIFVNPKQFGEGEDFDQYPRTEKSDRALLDQYGVDLLFAPSAKEMYPEGFSTNVQVTGLTDVLCGASRPGHFDGVATVVTKLLLQGGTDLAIFGEKDYQQLMVIRRFVQDLDIPVKILGAPIKREKDGLAMSSRNAYLSAKHREAAPQLIRCMKQAVKDMRAGKSAKAVLSKSTKELQSAGFKVDYLEARDNASLNLIAGKVGRPARLFAAAFLGKTRLIDNIKI